MLTNRLQSAKDSGMSRPLTAVKRATARRQAAETAYRQAIADARADGHTLRAIAEAAGLGVTGVRYLLYPDPRKEQKT